MNTLTILTVAAAVAFTPIAFAKSSNSSTSARSAKSGQYVKKTYAAKHKSTTVVERRAKRDPKGK